MEDIFIISKDGRYLNGVKNKNIIDAVIPDGVRVISDKAFYDCKSLLSVTIPQSVTHILDYVFANCSSLNSVILPQDLEELGSGAFYNCISLRSIDIPDKTICIGASVFDGCSSLCDVQLPNGITELYATFSGCSSLEEIDIPDSVEIIEYGSFYSCESLKEIDIPRNVKYIGQLAFSNCTSLESVDIPSNVISIQEDAFSYCSSLKTIFIHDKMSEIGRCAFAGTNTMIHIDPQNPYFFVKDEVLYKRINTDNNVLQRYYPLKNENIFIIDDSVSVIDCMAFNESSNLQEIYLPKSESISLEPLMFRGCTRLRAIHSFWSSLDNLSIARCAFDDFDIDNCILYVPSGSRWIYRHHPVFGKFKNIEIEI